MNTMEKLYLFFKFKSWKMWTIVYTLILFIGVLIFSYFEIPKNKWLELIIIPTIISFLMSVIVSLWFTIKADNDQFQLNLEIELDRLHESLMFTLTKATEIVSNPLFSNEEKVRQLNSYLITKVADTYYIEEKYNDLFLEYHQIVKRDLEFINLLDCTSTSKEFVNQFNRKFDDRAKEHHQFDVKVLNYRKETFEKRRANKSWVLKNKRVQKTSRK